MKAIFILAIGFIQVAPLFGQTKIKEDIPVVLENNMESMVASNTSAVDNLDVLEVMNEYSHSALNINQATLETLEQFPLLTEIQANAIIEHRNKFGKFRCVEELQVLNEFTLEDIRKILPFISVGSITPGLPLSLKNLVSEAEQSLTLRWQRSLGPQISTTETTRNYGDPTKLFAKYKYRFADRLRLGISAEKDPGEGFFSGKQQNGFDFYSAYLQWQQKGLIQKIILGDYTVQFGQGLVMWSGFGFGKSAETILIKRSARGAIPYTSADENNFFRGFAIKIGSRKWHSELFLSSNKMDGNLVQNDSTTSISALQTTGYHRNESEWNDRHSQTEKSGGITLNYQTRNFSSGAIFTLTEYSLPFQKPTEVYSAFRFYNRKNKNAGWNYNYLYRNMNLFGEIGISESGGKAMLQGVITQLHPNLATTILYRQYDKDYQAIHAHAFSENSETNNESGLYWGINWKINRAISISAYSDIFKFPWLKYQVSAPSRGRENLIQCTWLPKKTMEMFVRYRIQNKEENTSQGNAVLNHLASRIQENYRWNLRLDLDEKWEWSSRFDAIRTRITSGESSIGFAAYQELFYHPLKSIVSGSIRYSIFQCPSYDSRIYSYENDLLYSYSIPASYGAGSRAYINLRIRAGRGINFWLKYSTTVFTKPPPSVSVENDLPAKSDLKIQLMFQF